MKKQTTPIHESTEREAEMTDYEKHLEERRWYAAFHWIGLREYIAELDDEDIDDESRLYRVVGYLEAWQSGMDSLKDS